MPGTHLCLHFRGPLTTQNTKPRLLRLVAFFSFSWLALSVVMFPASNAELGCAMSDPPGKRHSTASLDADHGSTQYHQAWLHVNAWLLEHTSWGNSKSMARFSHSFELSGPQAPLVQARNLRRPFQIDGGRRWQCSSAAGSKCLRIANLQLQRCTTLSDSNRRRIVQRAQRPISPVQALGVPEPSYCPLWPPWRRPCYCSLIWRTHVFRCARRS